MAKKQQNTVQDEHLGRLPGEGVAVTLPEEPPQPERVDLVSIATATRTLGDCIDEDRFYTLPQFTEATGLPVAGLVKAFRARDPQTSGMWVMREGPSGDEVSGKSIREWFEKSGMMDHPANPAESKPESKPVRRMPEREHRPVEMVLVEIPLCDQPIVDGFHNSEGSAKHINFNVNSQRQNRNARRLLSGLEESGAMVDGKRVSTLADAMRWLLEHLAE